MNDNPLPPSPSGQTKKGRKADAKILRKAKKVALPQSDDADLIVHEQDSAPLGLESTSTFVGFPVAHEAQEANDDLMALEPKDATEGTAGHELKVADGETMAVESMVTSEAAAGHVPKVDQRGTENEPWPFILHPFQDESLILYERLAAFGHFERGVKASRREWENGPKTPCERCDKKHPPPCGTRSQLRALKEALDQGKQLRKDWEAQRARPLTLPHGEMLAGEVLMSHSPRGLTSYAKTAFCSLCAKFHPGGGKECNVPFCTKGCNLNHQKKESCGDAVKRFALIKKQQDGGEGESEKMSVPAPSAARATDDIDTEKFGAFYDAIGDDPDVVRKAADLFKRLAQKRPAEEPAEKSGSDKKGKKKAGSESSCQNPKPTPKGPPGPDDKGKGKAKPKRGGASSLSGTIFSLR
ncbi:unnamed protein product [Alternaria alternata]